MEELSKISTYQLQIKMNYVNLCHRILNIHDAQNFLNFPFSVQKCIEIKYVKYPQNHIEVVPKKCKRY